MQILTSYAQIRAEMLQHLPANFKDLCEEIPRPARETLAKILVDHANSCSCAAQECQDAGFASVVPGHILAVRLSMYLALLITPEATDETRKPNLTVIQ